MISAKSDVVSRNGSASDRIPAPARCMSRANQKVGRVARETGNGRGDDNIAGGELLHQCAKLRPVGRGAGNFLAEHFFASGHLELAHLSGFVLGGRRDAGIAVDHEPSAACRQIPAMSATVRGKAVLRRAGQAACDERR